MQNQCMENKKHQPFVNSFANFLVSYAQNNRAKVATLLYDNMDTLRYMYTIIIAVE